MSETDFDLIVIGAGPGGYTGAIRAAQLGLNVAVIEKSTALGGTCLNVGCIPSKALLDSSEHFEYAKHSFDKHGIMVSEVKLELSKLMERKNGIIKDLTNGVAYLFDKNKIKRFHGIGTITSANQVDIEFMNGDKQSIKGKNIMIATGSVPNELPFLPYDEKIICSSTGALELKSVPKKLVVIGGGVIGLELGSVWSRLGSEVTIVEFSGKIAGAMDARLSKKLQASLKKQGINFIMNAKVSAADIKTDSATLTYENMKDNSTATLEADVVLVATGRRPYTTGLGLENIGIETNKMGQVEINEHFATTIPSIYAIGDAVRGPMLAHKAEEEGVAVAEIISGQKGHVNYNTVPGVIYTWPEFASVGKTEEELKAEKIPVKVGNFPFTANARAKAMDCVEGGVKVIAHKDTDEVLGVHILGPRASDMIAEAVIAMEFKASAEDIARTFHAHPTLSEVMREAALDVDKKARQM